MMAELFRLLNKYEEAVKNGLATRREEDGKYIYAIDGHEIFEVETWLVK